MNKIFKKLLLGSLVVGSILNAIEISTYEYKGHSDKIYEFNNGTVIKIGYGYVGYMGYHQEVIFLEGNEVCMNGSKFTYKLYEKGSSDHYSINDYSGAEAYSKIEEICGEI